MKKLFLLTLFFQLSFLKAGEEGRPAKRLRLNAMAETQLCPWQKLDAARIGILDQFAKEETKLTQQFYKQVHSLHDAKGNSLIPQILKLRTFPHRPQFPYSERTRTLEKLEKIANEYGPLIGIKSYVCVYGLEKKQLTGSYAIQVRNTIYLASDLFKHPDSVLLGVFFHELAHLSESQTLKAIRGFFSYYPLLKVKHRELFTKINHHGELRADAISAFFIPKISITDFLLEMKSSGNLDLSSPTHPSVLERLASLKQITTHLEKHDAGMHPFAPIEFDEEKIKEAGLITHEQHDISRILHGHEKVDLSLLDAEL